MRRILAICSLISISIMSGGCRESHHTCDPTGKWKVNLMAFNQGTCNPDGTISFDEFIIANNAGNGGADFKVFDLTDRNPLTLEGQIDHWSCHLGDLTTGVYNLNLSTQVTYTMARDYSLSGDNDQFIFGFLHSEMTTTTDTGSTLCITDWEAAGIRLPELQNPSVTSFPIKSVDD